MAKLTISIIIITLQAIAGLGQSLQLKPAIGLFTVPQSNSPICPIPTYTGNYNSSGIQQLDTIADFTLYDINNQPVNIRQELEDGKPILLVSGSYTCPVFRNKLPALNQVVSQYGSSVKTFIIYTVEAHPIVDPSPYSGTVWVTSQNQQEGVLYRQAQDYGQRLSLVNEMKSKMNILSPILLDGPCNEWWQYFGPAPNNAYLIKPDGTVFRKHGWFHKAPDDIFCDIDSLMGTPCSGVAYNGTFTFSLKGDSIVKGYPGDVLYGYGELKNQSQGPVEIDVKRLQNQIPAGWGSAICVDICLSPTDNETYFILQPGQTQSYTMYFYTDTIPSSGKVRMGFRNKNLTSNSFSQYFYAKTEFPEPAKVSESAKTNNWFFPNPSKGWIYCTSDNIVNLSILNTSGMEVLNISTVSEKGLNLSHLPQGLYYVSYFSNGVKRQQKLVLLQGD
jgi:hypothetical protein